MEKELANKLWEMYNKAPKGFRVVKIHLFGIKYVHLINDNCLMSLTLFLPREDLI